MLLLEDLIYRISETNIAAINTPSDRTCLWQVLLHSSKQHLSNDDCLEDKNETYCNCSLQYCVPQTCRVAPNSPKIWFIIHKRFSQKNLSCI